MEGSNINAKYIVRHGICNLTSTETCLGPYCQKIANDLPETKNVLLKVTPMSVTKIKILYYLHWPRKVTMKPARNAYVYLFIYVSFTSLLF